MRHGLEVQEQIEPALIDLAMARDLPLVATNDVHFIDGAGWEAHDVLLCIADGTQVAQGERRRITPEHRFKTAAEMAELFADLPEALVNTLVIAQRCAFRVPSQAPILPVFPTTAGQSEIDELRARPGRARDAPQHPDPPDGMDLAARAEAARPYRERLDYELGVIEGMNYAGYFLIVADFINGRRRRACRSVRVAGRAPARSSPGRSRSPTSTLALRPAVRALPQSRARVDARFRHRLRQDRRDDVIRYVRDKYGSARVAAIITFGKLQARARCCAMSAAHSACRTAKSTGSPSWCRSIRPTPDLEQALVLEPRLAEAAREDEQVARLIAIAQQLEGSAARLDPCRGRGDRRPPAR